VGKTVTTRDSISIRWNPGSEYTAYFLVYGRRLTVARRDISTGDFSLLTSGNLTSYTATNLAPGASYEFRLVGVTADNSSNSEATFTFQTASVAENANELPPGGTLRGRGLCA